MRRVRKRMVVNKPGQEEKWSIMTFQIFPGEMHKDSRRRQDKTNMYVWGGQMMHLME